MKHAVLSLLVLVLAHAALPPAHLAQTQSSYVVSGLMQDVGGQYARGVRVCARLEGQAQNRVVDCAVSDAEGRFTLKLREAGRYWLFTDNTAEGYVPLSNPFYMHASASVPVVTLDDENASRQVTITVGPKAGRLVFTISDASVNLPVENATVRMCKANAPRICINPSAKDAEGKFRLLAPLVPFTLKITADGYDDWHGPSGGDAPGTPLDIGPGQKLEFSVFLKRRADASGRAFYESEKHVGIHLPAPVQVSPQADAVFDHYPRKTKLEWEPVEGAISYSVEVDFCRGQKLKGDLTCVEPQPHVLKNNPPTKGLTVTTHEFDFVGAQPGRWRVWAVDKEGREGFKSPWRRFVYTK